ncbi:hypothetical protein SM882_003356 [Yersinia enterocolitica]|uniref:hypothetical protein n=1 Tax=Yersinia TaxID=629 RepID=UPI000BFEA52B|nr:MULTISPECIES: hypothetical protein [Yersinia]ATM85935.1 hypothetical protein CRN74_07495 [Yersinia frederiksenii]EKN3510090.1 hypothetical protein [Yersinia enterocolitica]EKN3693647.1 hypothetical protein [Yersinia enterocolitica]EKN3697597.1 hypothetical protein [Yersinia enterocolitica]EKN3721793.1 hypothetical protein [Yersinia enterocolitica]
MANNLFVTYDLIKTKDYPAVHEAIKSLGYWAKVTESNWYVSSAYSTLDAANIVKKAMDKDDKLIVVNASNKTAHWYNLSDEVATFIKNNWNN